MYPVAFEGCSGWLHLPSPARRLARGVVLCAPLGYEELCTRRAWRQLADMLAEAGLPTLRFDYPGTGDSAGDEAPGLVADALAAIGAAMALLRQQAGVQEVALCGLRFGALLAADFAQRAGSPVSAVALLAPPASGASLMRELAMLGMAQPGGLPPGDWMEVAGFRLHVDDTRAIGRLAWTDLLSQPARPNLLVLEPPGRAGSCVAEAAAAGPAATRCGFAGCPALLQHAHLAETPVADFAGVARWLADGAPAAPLERAWTPPVAALRIGRHGLETAVAFGPEGSLHGVLCQPTRPGRNAARLPAVLLLNTGANRRIGNARLAVRLARRLAAQGIVSLRFDASGVGDSPTATGLPDGAVPPDVYRPELQAEVKSALDQLQQRGCARAVVVGLCAGAHQAFQSALEDRRITGLVLGNLPAFDRAAGGAPALDGGPPPGEHPRWRRLRMLQRRLLAEMDHALAKGLGLEPGLDRANAWLRALARRGTSLLLVYSTGDRGLRELRAHFGRGGRRLAGQKAVQRVVLAGTDHSLQPRPMQEAFIHLVEQHLHLHHGMAAPQPLVPQPTQPGPAWASPVQHGVAAMIPQGGA